MTDEPIEVVVPTPTLAETAAGSPPQRSAADILRAGYEKSKGNRALKRIQLAGYGEPDAELWVTFRCLSDYGEVRDGVTATAKRRHATQAALEIATSLDTLRMAAVGSYAVIDGEEVDIGLPLGLPLYHHLFGTPTPGPENDNQAITLLFHENTTVIVARGLELDRWMTAGGPEDEQALGESQAA